ncbi:hypothetical protein J7M28_04330 [bacterium]|nr:hypothetical protein [bacterium]
MDAMSIHGSLLQAAAAEKIAHVESHQGETNQQLFAAELAKSDEQRAHEIQSTHKTEDGQQVDARGSRGGNASEKESSSHECSDDSETEEDVLFNQGETHLIDITI